MSTPIIDDAAKVFATPKAYTDETKFHAALTHLRANAPVSWVDVDGYRPFWAITKHADIMEVERANTLFTNSPRPVLVTAEGDELQAGIGVKTLIHMDDPQHRDVRAIGANWFRPKAMRAMKVRIGRRTRAGRDSLIAVAAAAAGARAIRNSMGCPRPAASGSTASSRRRSSRSAETSWGERPSPPESSRARR